MIEVIKKIRNIFVVLLVLIVLVCVKALFFDYSAVLPLTVTGCVFLTEYVFFQVMCRGVRININASETTTYEKEDTKFFIDIVKRFNYPFKKIKLYIRYKPRYGAQEFRKKIVIELGDKKEEKVCVSLPEMMCGYNDVEINRAYVFDFFGFAGRKPVCERKLCSVAVMPKKVYCELNLSQIPWISGDESEIFLEDAGKDGQTANEYRSYRGGDSLKKVNWKLSSKLDELLVRENEKIVNTHFYVYFNLCNKNDINGVFEEAVSMVYKVLSEKQPVYAVWIDSERQRLCRELISDEKHVEEVVRKIMKSPVFEMNAVYEKMVRNLVKENKELYKIFKL